MPRAKSDKRETLVAAAMFHFWRHGFEATSIDDLVRVTGVSRQGIYKDAGGKDALFALSLRAYIDTIVSPAFSQVEEAGADLTTVARFFEFQITRGEEAGLPGPGCFLTNTMTEVAPHRAEAMSIVNGHNERLHRGFSAALSNAAAGQDYAWGRGERRTLSWSLVVFANGLWTLSRTISDAAVLRHAARETLQLIEQRLSA
jgi:TetR/AcrR family transcriptional regulator, transcriptional repressor for nem operon